MRVNVAAFEGPPTSAVMSGIDVRQAYPREGALVVMLLSLFPRTQPVVVGFQSGMSAAPAWRSPRRDRRATPRERDIFDKPLRQDNVVISTMCEQRLVPTRLSAGLGAQVPGPVRLHLHDVT